MTLWSSCHDSFCTLLPLLLLLLLLLSLIVYHFVAQCPCKSLHCQQSWFSPKSCKHTAAVAAAATGLAAPCSCTRMTTAYAGCL
jgi:hypothetical protein